LSSKYQKLNKKGMLMKEKRTSSLSCERARAFPIEKALAKLGHYPTTSPEKEALFLRPLRTETQASFKVSKKLNRWYDHGAGKGGNVIDLICQITNNSVKEALKIIQEDQISFSFQQHHSIEKEYEDTIEVLYARPIRHFGLLRYLQERRISMAIASKYCQEVHYIYKGRNYFALGLKNDSGGWELRNKYYKNCSSPKDITHIKNGNDKLIIIEGMFDLLSLINYNGILESEYDFLVLNSTGFVSKGKKIMVGYNEIDLYLDNDSNGKRTVANLMEHSKKCSDKSLLYKEFKDINEWLTNTAKMEFGQQRQDVFLLSQKQSCFAPDGCKEFKK
jgi:hypothetical protein